jgi:hypothetical protein
MSDEMAVAVEAGGKALGEHQALPNPWDVDWDEKVARRVLEAARPLMPEARALARVRELADEWDARGGGYGILGPTLRAAIEGSS